MRPSRVRHIAIANFGFVEAVKRSLSVSQHGLPTHGFSESAHWCQSQRNIKALAKKKTAGSARCTLRLPNRLAGPVWDDSPFVFSVGQFTVHLLPYEL
jgi:hypothetical protein